MKRSLFLAMLLAFGVSACGEQQKPAMKQTASPAKPPATASAPASSATGATAPAAEAPKAGAAPAAAPAAAAPAADPMKDKAGEMTKDTMNK